MSPREDVRDVWNKGFWGESRGRCRSESGVSGVLFTRVCSLAQHVYPCRVDGHISLGDMNLYDRTG